MEATLRLCRRHKLLIFSTRQQNTAYVLFAVFCTCCNFIQKDKNMKKLFIIVLLCFAGHISSYGQCAVAACAETGAWGAGYNAGNEHYTDEEYKQFAMKGCKDNGGTDCKIMGIDNIGGWYACISGKAKNGHAILGISVGKGSKSDAELDAAQTYTAQAGINASNYKVLTWRVYTKGN
jgi:hypothetical protein